MPDTDAMHIPLLWPEMACITVSICTATLHDESCIGKGMTIRLLVTSAGPAANMKCCKQRAPVWLASTDHVKGKIAVCCAFGYIRNRNREQKSAETSSSSAEEQKFARLESYFGVKKGVQRFTQKVKVHLVLTCHLQN